MLGVEGTTAARFCSRIATSTGTAGSTRAATPAASSKRRVTRRTRPTSPFPTGGPPTQAAVDRFRGHAGYFPCAAAATFAACTPGAGQFKVAETSEIYFNRDGSPFVLAGARGYNAGFEGSTDIGDGYAGMRLQPNGDLGQVAFDGQASSPLDRRSLFGRATHELNDNLTAFAQASYSSVEVSTTGGGYSPAITVWSAPVPFDGGRFPRRCKRCSQPARGPDGRRRQQTAPWQLFRRDGLRRSRPRRTWKSDVYQIMAGVEGGFGQRDWTWEAYVSSGQTATATVLEHAVVAALLEPHRRLPERFDATRCAGQRHLGPRHLHPGPQLRSELHERLADLRESSTLGAGQRIGGLPREHRVERPLADGARATNRRVQLAGQNRRHEGRRAAIRGGCESRARTSSRSSRARPTIASRSSSNR